MSREEFEEAKGIVLGIARQIAKEIGADQKEILEDHDAFGRMRYCLYYQSKSNELGCWSEIELEDKGHLPDFQEQVERQIRRRLDGFFRNRRRIGFN